MASVEKRNNGYIVKYREPNGKHRTKGGFRTKKAAEDYATRAEAAKLAGVTFDPREGKRLFRDVASAWLTSRYDLKETTRAAYADALAPTPTVGQRTKRHARLADLRIDAVFGDYPINTIRREHVSDWVGRMKKAGKSHSTIRNALFLVRMVLRFAADEKWIPSNPAADVKLPRSTSVGEPGVVDDPAQFLTAAQVAALAQATPWPYNVVVQVAAWSGLRAGELAGLQVVDVELPSPSINPNVATKPGGLHVARTLARVGSELRYLPPKTKGSRRRVPLTAATTALLRDYLAAHPRADEPTAPLFPAVSLKALRPTGVRNPEGASAAKQAAALANLSVAEAGERLALDWSQPVRHATFYKAVFRPAVVRVNRAATVSGEKGAALPPGLTWHALRHTYASLCVAAGLSALEVSRFMGHSKPTTTLAIYTHLFSTDDHADAMAALGAMVATPTLPANVVPLHG